MYLKCILLILFKRWSGTGDKKLDQILITPDYYATRHVSVDDFRSIFASLV